MPETVPATPEDRSARESDGPQLVRQTGASGSSSVGREQPGIRGAVRPAYLCAARRGEEQRANAALKIVGRRDRRNFGGGGRGHGGDRCEGAPAGSRRTQRRPLSAGLRPSSSLFQAIHSNFSPSAGHFPKWSLSVAVAPPPPGEQGNPGTVEPGCQPKYLNEGMRIQESTPTKTLVKRFQEVKRNGRRCGARRACELLRCPGTETVRTRSSRGRNAQAARLHRP